MVCEFSDNQVVLVFSPPHLPKRWRHTYSIEVLGQAFIASSTITPIINTDVEEGNVIWDWCGDMKWEYNNERQWQWKYQSAYSYCILQCFSGAAICFRPHSISNYSPLSLGRITALFPSRFSWAARGVLDCLFFIIVEDGIVIQLASCYFWFLKRAKQDFCVRFLLGKAVFDCRAEK